jgi:hypothetical protein
MLTNCLVGVTEIQNRQADSGPDRSRICKCAELPTNCLVALASQNGLSAQPAERIACVLASREVCWKCLDFTADREKRPPVTAIYSWAVQTATSDERGNKGRNIFHLSLDFWKRPEWVTGKGRNIFHLSLDFWRTPEWVTGKANRNLIIPHLKFSSS